MKFMTEKYDNYIGGLCPSRHLKLVSHMGKVNGPSWTRKNTIIQRMCKGLQINPNGHPLAFAKLSRLITAPSRHPQTGLIRHDKIDTLVRSLKDAPELLSFTSSHSPESLRDMMTRSEIVLEVDQEGIGITNSIKALKILAETEDMESEQLVCSTILLFASEKLKEAKSPTEVVEIVDLYQRYLPQAVSEFGIGFLDILVNQAEITKANLEKHLELSIKDQLSVMKGEKDLIHRLLHILTWTGINRACFFGPMADGYMAIGSVTRKEHEDKIKSIPQNADQTELIEPPGVFNPREDEPLNKQIKSFKLPLLIPDYPILIENEKIYRVSEDRVKSELEIYSNFDLFLFSRALKEGMKFDKKEVSHFLVIPVLNGTKLGFIYLDNAYDDHPIGFAELVKRVNYTGPIIDSAQKREKEKNDKMIGGLLWDWLNDYKQFIDAGKGSNSAIRRGYQITYRDNVLRKEGAEFIRKINIGRLIEESLRRINPHGMGQTNIEIDESVSDFYFQPYHMQGIIDGMVMNAIWCQEVKDNKKYEIVFKVERRGNDLVIRATNAGAKMEFQRVHDFENLDLGTAIISESLDVKLADPTTDLARHGDLHILDPAENHGPGLEVVLTNIEFSS